MKNLNKVIIAVGLISFVVFIAILLIGLGDSDTVELTESNTQSTDSLQPQTDNSQFADPEEVEEPEPNEPKKEPVANVTVSESPVIYTGYGNVAEKPLGLTQATSTTCTTDAGVECQLTFTNSATGKSVSFDAKTTDNTGVALWSWTGSDVGSGTWEVVGTAGDKSSDVSIIYIQ